MVRFLRHWAAATSLAAAAAFFSTAATAEPRQGEGTIIPLYPKGSLPPPGVPELRVRLKTGETMIYDVSEPTLELFRPIPGRANGTAVIVAPGGGFVALGYTFGGTDVARALAGHGITAFVLKYRTIRSGDGPMRMPDVHMKEMDSVMARAKSGNPVEMPPFAGEPHAVQDGARAMTIVRQRTPEWGIDPRKIGFIGFSAGAYLAADVAIGDAASRPAFVGMIYGGLRTPVPANAPPAFIASAVDDDDQPNDLILLFTAWRQAGQRLSCIYTNMAGIGSICIRKARRAIIGLTSSSGGCDLATSWYRKETGELERLVYGPGLIGRTVATSA